MRAFSKLSLVLFSSCLAAQTASAHELASNRSLYAETKADMRLHLNVTLENGERALVPLAPIPEGTILAMDLDLISRSLYAQKNNPQSVNYLYMDSADPQASKPKMSEKGWVCGIRIVDIADEELRDGPYVDREDFCVSQTMLKEIKILEGNADQIREAMNVYQATSDTTALFTLAAQVRQADERFQEMPIETVADLPRMISPIKDCGEGCLRATSEYGMRNHPKLKVRRLHKGIDLRASTGTAVVAPYAGRVLAQRVERQKLKKGRVGRMKGYGQYLIVVHPSNGVETLYGHLSSFVAKTGSEVEQGQLIALSGNTGLGTGPHLHFEVHVKGKKGYSTTNPRPYLSHLLERVAAFFEKFFNLAS